VTASETRFRQDLASPRGVLLHFPSHRATGTVFHRACCRPRLALHRTVRVVPSQQPARCQARLTARKSRLRKVDERHPLRLCVRVGSGPDCCMSIAWSAAHAGWDNIRRHR